jgi:hypothetical protein
LGERVCNVECTDFFVVLEFQEFIAAMASHVDKDIGSLITQKTF